MSGLNQLRPHPGPLPEGEGTFTVMCQCVLNLSNWYF